MVAAMARKAVTAALAATTCAASGGSSAQSPALRAEDVSLGDAFSCALLRDSGAEDAETLLVRCWGDNLVGQLGAPTPTDLAVDPAPPIALAAAPLSLPRRMGQAFGCVLIKGGKVSCFGSNDVGQLGRDGDGDGYLGSGAPSPLPAVELRQQALQLALGDRHACALLRDRSLQCWGDSRLGQTDGDGLERVRIVDCGATHCCAVTDDAGTLCWGQPAASLANASALNLGLGQDFSCGLFEPDDVSIDLQDAADVFVRCWGDAAPSAELFVGGGGGGGDDDDDDDDDDGFRVEALTVGGSHVCAIDGGKVKCLGKNAQGQLGLGDTRERDGAAVDLPEVDLPGKARGLAAGRYHTCATMEERGEVVCWGYNLKGQLGRPREDGVIVGDAPGEMGASLKPVRFAPPQSAAPSAAPTTVGGASGGNGQGLPPGAIAAAVTVPLLLALAAGIFVVRRRKNARRRNSIDSLDKIQA